MANILSTANSALNAAQQGLATTAHNIANQKTPGYNRQLVLQAAIGGQDEGGGFIGKGTEVISVRRVYNEYLGAQIRTTQTKNGELSSHYAQANRINNLMADPTSGLSPVLQDFFKSVQNLAANPEARGSMLAAGESMASRFQSLDGQLRELRGSVNSELSTSVSAINSFAQQIADLNKAITAADSGTGQLPNDLLDKRDYLIGELSKETKVTATKDGNSYNIFIGNGQPMVVGSVV
ncbi:MAG TPA: flagellar hook-associated protein FlgK, partial [Noviherbaspirillum sp.]|nr:flagellar hook-associated protein FlgK [Noviherbaspirillum sp.]